MIPKASQRGDGQELAAHLLNAFDNEQVEVMEVRGAAARDLHGAFKEWEFQSQALTKCKKYLYSLSISPDDRQEPLSEAQRADYIARIEDRLGLTSQPRAVIRHVKDGREHFHFVWSRIDPAREKAVHLAFDREKLMMVTREWAKEHGLRLPGGYAQNGKGRDYRDKETLYERFQQQTTGISKSERKALITDLWRQSDTPGAFVAALADNGYILAQGKRPYVLVDIYGNANTLPKLIDDKSVRTKDICAFLGKDYPPGDLPSVDEAKAIAEQHLKAMERHKKTEQHIDEKYELRRDQARRRNALKKDLAHLKREHATQRAQLAHYQRAIRLGAKSRHLQASRAARTAFWHRQPKGLAGFLARATGLSLVRKKRFKHHERQRLEAFQKDYKELVRKQAEETAQRYAAQQLERSRLERQLRALEQVEKRELISFEQKAQSETRARQHKKRGTLPALTPELRLPGPKNVPAAGQPRVLKPEEREGVEPLEGAFDKATKARLTPERLMNPASEFNRAARPSREERGKGDDDKAPPHRPAPRPDKGGDDRGR